MSTARNVPLPIWLLATACGGVLGGVTYGLSQVPSASVVSALSLGAAIILFFYFSERKALKSIGARLQVAAQQSSIIEAINGLSADNSELVRTVQHHAKDMRDLLENLTDAVIIVDQDATVSKINEAALGFFNIASFQKQSLIEITRSPKLQRLAEEAKLGTKTKEEIVLPRSKITAKVLATPRHDGGAMLVMRDVTKVRRLERVRRDFVANVSHELRTPVSILSANTETLLEGDVPGDIAKKLLESSQRNSLRLAQLIADLLDLAKLESGTFGNPPESIDVSEMLHQVVALLKNKVNTKEQDIVISGDELSIWADRLAAEQVFYNFINNAINYIPQGGRIEIRLSQLANSGKVAVNDNGPGIAPKHRARIFERFYRVDPGRSKELGGTGLGLSICKHLVENNNGEIGYDTSDLGGACFWATFPLATS